MRALNEKRGNMEQKTRITDAERFAIVCLEQGNVPNIPDEKFSAKRFMLKQMAFYVAKTFMVGSRSSFLRKWFALKVARLVAESAG